MSTRNFIRVTDKKSPYYGQTLSGYVCYYDIHHTGNSPDLYLADTEDGHRVQLLSTQIDEQYYWEQEREKHIQRLGANIGDKVRILDGFGGHFNAGWKREGIHTITEIDSSGGVTFDDGAASMFRPVVEVVS